MTHYLRWLLTFTLCATCYGSMHTYAQPLITDTPVPVVLPSSTPQPTGIIALTPTPTLTVTIQPAIRLVAAAASADINVRDAPDVTGNRLGSLEQGREYVVRGRFFSWYQFDYGSSNSGLAWVFGDLVEIIGDESEIPVVDPFAVPTAVPTGEVDAATATALALTPGAAETATAQTRLVDLPTLGPGTAESDTAFFPTFTPPPDLVPRIQQNGANTLSSPTPTPNFAEQAVTLVASGGVPPLAPIVTLFAFGLIGLIIALLRG